MSNSLEFFLRDNNFDTTDVEPRVSVTLPFPTNFDESVDIQPCQGESDALDKLVTTEWDNDYSNTTYNNIVLTNTNNYIYVRSENNAGNGSSAVGYAKLWYTNTSLNPASWIPIVGQNGSTCVQLQQPTGGGSNKQAAIFVLNPPTTQAGHYCFIAQVTTVGNGDPCSTINPNNNPYDGSINFYTFMGTYANWIQKNATFQAASDTKQEFTSKLAKTHGDSHGFPNANTYDYFSVTPGDYFVTIEFKNAPVGSKFSMTSDDEKESPMIKLDPTEIKEPNMIIQFHFHAEKDFEGHLITHWYSNGPFSDFSYHLATGRPLPLKDPNEPVFPNYLVKMDDVPYKLERLGGITHYIVNKLVQGKEK